MNTNSITKFFTLVSFFVVTVFMSTTNALPTPNECKTKVKNITVSDVTNCSKDGGFETAADIEACNTAKTACSEAKAAAREENTDKRADDKERDSACEAAFKEYKETRDDAKSACESVVGKSTTTDTKKSCSNKIEECANMAASTSSQTEQQDGGISSTLNIFRAVIGGEESLGLSGSSCLVDIDSKEARDAEKEFRDRRKELQDEKKKIEDDAIKDKEDNDKEITRITKEIQELQRENKKTIAEVDTRMREKNFDSQKELAAAGARIKELTKQASVVGDKIKSLNFSYSQRMLNASQQKQNLRCKSALDTAKGCMIKSAKGIVDPACKDFPFTIKSKGPKATAELKAQLQIVSDACYEKEESDKKALQFDNQQQLTVLERQLTGFQEQMQQEAESQKNNSENSKKIQQEAEQEKQDAQANLAEQIATLQGEMAQFAQKLQAKSIRSQERLQKLAQDLQTLELEEKTGKRSKTKLAQRAVREANSNLDEVKAKCDCPDLVSPQENSKKRAAICASARSDLPSGGTDKKKRTSGKSSSSY